MKSERDRLTLTLVGIGAAGLLTAGLLFQLAHPTEPESTSPAIVVSPATTAPSPEPSPSEPPAPVESPSSEPTVPAAGQDRLHTPDHDPGHERSVHHESREDHHGGTCTPEEGQRRRR